MKKYVVITTYCGWPNGKLLSREERYFDDFNDALKYQELNTWESPDCSAKAYLYRLGVGYIPVEGLT